MTVIIENKTTDFVPVFIIAKDDFSAWLDQQDAIVKNWLGIIQFKANAGHSVLVPDNNGGIHSVIFITYKEFDAAFYARLPAMLPAGDYKVETELSTPNAYHLALGWLLQQYEFTDFKTKKRTTENDKPRLIAPVTLDVKKVENEANAIFLARDLINRPANDLTPTSLADEAEKIARRYNSKVRIIIGDDLIKENYPAIFTVGQASITPARLVDFTWGNADAPKVTLVGKGVTFDTGGLDIKDAGSMLTMKKDMGGAATALGLAQLIMAQNLNVCLRVLIPAVENAIAGNAMRPLDVMKTRKGLTVEIGNTDAEGRLILADCLFEAAQEKPDLLIDFATLTGAARVALGPELPAIFCQQEELTAELLESSRQTNDPVWPLPLWPGYRQNLESRVADLNNISAGGFAGAIHAGLFLQEFVEPDTNWIHIDTYAWNYKSRPGRPEGGEALALRACYNLIERRYA